MGTAHVTFGPVMGGGAPVYGPAPSKAETITTTSSAQTTNTANSGEYARVVAVSGAKYVLAGQNPTAAATSGYYVPEGSIIDVGPLAEADKVAAIDV